MKKRVHMERAFFYNSISSVFPVKSVMTAFPDASLNTVYLPSFRIPSKDSSQLLSMARRGSSPLSSRSLQDMQIVD